MSKKHTGAGSPAGIQKSIHEKFQEKEREREKEKEKDKEKGKGTETGMESVLQALKSIEAKQDAMGARQEAMGKDVRETATKVELIEKRTEKIDDKVEKMDGKIEELQQMMKEREMEIKEIKEEMVKRDKKTEEIESRLEIVEKDHSNLAWEIDHAGFYLRFQNVEEEKEEDLAELMANMLAAALEITIEKMREGMDKIYRVYTRFAFKNKLPREVHIRFTKQSTKEEILQVLRNKTLNYKGKEIKVLKQTPKKVRDLRREYKCLTKELLKREINYRWLFPEGLLFTLGGQRHRIISSVTAEMFVYEHFGGLGEGTSTQQGPVETPTTDITLLEQEEGAVGGLPREQREVRTTRAINPIYKS